MNLRDLTKKYGRNKGLNIEAVQLFASQLLIALRHLRKQQVGRTPRRGGAGGVGVRREHLRKQSRWGGSGPGQVLID